MSVNSDNNGSVLAILATVPCYYPYSASIRSHRIRFLDLAGSTDPKIPPLPSSNILKEGGHGCETPRRP